MTSLKTYLCVLKMFDAKIYLWHLQAFLIRERPFNLKGGVMFFFLKKYSDAQCCWKKSDSEFLSYNLMLNSGKKILNETKNHNPPFTLNGRSLSGAKIKKNNYILIEV